MKQACIAMLKELCNCCNILYRLFRLFRFYVETESFDVSIEPKQTDDLPKQFHKERILELFRKFRIVSVCLGLFRNSFVCFSCFEIGSKHRNKPKLFVFGFTKQNEAQPKQILFRFEPNFCCCLFRGHLFVCFSCFDIGSKHRNKPKLFVFGFTKQTEAQPKQILFRFEP